VYLFRVARRAIRGPRRRSSVIHRDRAVRMYLGDIRTDFLDEYCERSIRIRDWKRLVEYRGKHRHLVSFNDRDDCWPNCNSFAATDWDTACRADRNAYR
jgi:hypothetical protein